MAKRSTVSGGSVCIVKEQLAVGRLLLAGQAPTVYRKRDAPGKQRLCSEP